MTGTAITRIGLWNTFSVTEPNTFKLMIENHWKPLLILSVVKKNAILLSQKSLSLLKIPAPRMDCENHVNPWRTWEVFRGDCDSFMRTIKGLRTLSVVWVIWWSCSLSKHFLLQSLKQPGKYLLAIYFLNSDPLFNAFTPTPESLFVTHYGSIQLFKKFFK